MTTLVQLINAKFSQHRLGLWLLFSCSISLLLIVYRMWHTGHLTYIFLVWNLFLAWIPLGMVGLLHRLRPSKTLLLLALPCWLAFFPNAPYVLTDLYHLKLRGGMPVWFDMLLILSFAWNSLMFGFLSLMQLEQLLQQHFKPMVSLSLIHI